MKYYAITGRLCGDSEDTLHIVEATDAEKAQEIWQEKLLRENGYETIEAWFAEHDGEFSENDSGIYLNHIVESDAPMRMIYEANY